jgi:hypothetical protein
MTPFAHQLGTSLRTIDTEANRREWAEYILRNGIPLDELVELVSAERKTAMRFMWLTGLLCELKPELISPHAAYFFEKRHTVTFPNYDRSVAKILSLAGIPEHLEGEVSTELFNWLLDPSISVSTKSYALTALCRLSDKHPELKNELKLVVEDQCDKNSVSFQKRAKRFLAEMRIIADKSS